MLAGIYYGAQYGGTITSVLLRLPGEASSVVTVFDGFALAKQGKAGTALGIAAIGSFVGAHRLDHRADPAGPARGGLGAGLRPARVRRAGAARRAARRHHRQRQHGQGADRRLARAAAGHRRPRHASPAPAGSPSTACSSPTASTSSSSRWASSASARSSTTSRSGTASRTCRPRSANVWPSRAGPEAVLRRHRPRLGASASSSACCPAAAR